MKHCVICGEEIPAFPLLSQVLTPPCTCLDIEACLLRFRGQMQITVKPGDGPPMDTLAIATTCPPPPRTAEEKRAFEADWDRRVEEGWAKNGRPPVSNQRGAPYKSIIGSKKPRAN